MAEAGCLKFPKSGRARALWLNNLPDSTPLADLERKTPPLLRMDPEVAMVMAQRSLAMSDHPRAQRFAHQNQRDLD